MYLKKSLKSSFIKMVVDILTKLTERQRILQELEGREIRVNLALGKK